MIQPKRRQFLQRHFDSCLEDGCSICSAYLLVQQEDRIAALLDAIEPTMTGQDKFI